MPTLNTFKYKQDIQDKSVAIAPSCLSYFLSDKIKLSFFLNEEETFHQYPQKFTSYIVDFKFHIFSFEFTLTPKLEKFIIASFKKLTPYITLDDGFNDLTTLNAISKIHFEDYEIILNGEKNIILNIRYYN